MAANRDTAVLIVQGTQKWCVSCAQHRCVGCAYDRRVSCAHHI